MPDRPTLTALLVRRLQDADAVLAASDHDDALAAALDAHSQRRPDYGLTDLTGDGSTIVFSLPADWEPELSQVVRIESPVGAIPPTYLDARTYQVILQAVAGTPTDTEHALQFAGALPSGQVARVLYTRRHTATASTTSLPASMHRPVATLGAALALEWLATQTTRQGAGSLSADTVDHSSRADRYRTSAARLRDEYDRRVPRRTPRQIPVTR